MTKAESENFLRLKEKVHQKAQERLSIRKEFADWSLGDIADFQADLQAQCKSSVSEKWFYNHLKKQGRSLPRIDVLNLLSCYAGFRSWDDFSNQATKDKGKTKLRSLLYLIPLALLVLMAFWAWPAGEEKTVILTDAYTRENISTESVKMWFKEGVYVKPVFGQIKDPPEDTLYLDGPYYKPQKRYVGPSDTLWITLFPDDYALMLNYFSRSTTTNWQKRQGQLMEAFHPEAKIFQSHPRYEGIEMLNRDEFIERLILPINSLRNLEIQDIVYRNDKIYRLRFTQKTEEDEKE
ncbi:MAG TPA: hypothetical protein DDW81_03125 [Cryomorphaceae bacterium]|nr:hypothetical protein [Owenweeksia sp.]HBF19061.1 hypothetical protein [Cryomorphaceae bacterium]|tara:strand:- start:1126 stop:2004 length:879 start_codon:yes stop_codon:yes gene_type:complete